MFGAYFEAALSICISVRVGYSLLWSVPRNGTLSLICFASKSLKDPEECLIVGTVVYADRRLPKFISNKMPLKMVAAGCDETSLNFHTRHVIESQKTNMLHGHCCENFRCHSLYQDVTSPYGVS